MVAKARENDQTGWLEVETRGIWGNKTLRTITENMMMILKRVGIRRGENRGREYKENNAGKPKDDRKR